jgi:protein ImuA
VAPVAYGDTPAAMGFALALALRRLADGFERRPVLWCRLDYQVREHGLLYGHGLEGLGLSRQRLLTVTLKTPISLLWTMEEALKSGALAVVLGDCALQHSDLTVTRRLALAADAGKCAGLLVFNRNNQNATASMSRWQVATAASVAPAFDVRAPGVPAFAVSLTRIRSGRPGQWTLNWNRQDHAPHYFSLVSGLRGGALHSREAQDQGTSAAQGFALRAG